MRVSPALLTRRMPPVGAAGAPGLLAFRVTGPESGAMRLASFDPLQRTLPGARSASRQRSCGLFRVLCASLPDTPGPSSVNRSEPEKSSKNRR